MGEGGSKQDKYIVPSLLIAKEKKYSRKPNSVTEGEGCSVRYGEQGRHIEK